MFAKLLKHEFLATWRMLGAVVGAAWAVSLMALIPTWLNVPLIGLAGQSLAALGFILGGVAVLFLLGVHYWRTMYSGPGYFTHSLPVRGRTIFAAKVTYIIPVSVAALAAGFVLGTFLPGMATADSATQLRAVWDAMMTVMSPGQFWAIVIVTAVCCAAELLIYLCAITLGTRGAFNRMGLGGVVLAVVICHMAMQIVAAVALFVVPLSVRISATGMGGVVVQPMGLDFLNGKVPELLGVGWFPMYIVLAIVASIWAARSVDRHTCLV